MPAPSKVMRKAAAIAEHHPEDLFARNKSLLGMTHEQLHDFASTSEAGLPERKGSLRRLAERKRNG
jgi:hypothetical protein